VRLLHGDFAAETVYADDPVGVARSFAEAGARWVHVVDLDGAREGAPRQAAVVARIVGGLGEQVAVEVAGGLRDESAVEAALTSGAARVVLATAILADRALAGALVARHGPGRIAAALDVRDGCAVGGGWVAGARGWPVEEALTGLRAAGIETFVVTAISRDGTLGGPDLALLERLVRLAQGRVIASGGLGSLEDLLRVRAIGCGGAILGRALYEGRFSLAEALAAIG
jgi:phosphoribosylformimino-5-aminoimidazole carboxamide ribotide isomerase